MSKSLGWKKLFAVSMLTAELSLGSSLCLAADDASVPQRPASADAGLYVKVQLADRLKMSKLKPGEVVEGTLSRDVYSADRRVLAAGSQVRLTVDHLEKRRRPRNDHWPWVVNAFTPRHENYPVFTAARIEGVDGERSLQVSLIAVSRRREVHAQAKKDKSKPQSVDEPAAVQVSASNARKPAAPTLIFEAASVEPSLAGAETPKDAAPSESSSPHPETIPSGTQCKILLLGNMSASRSKTGDVVRARLLEPVVLNSTVVLPAGSMFEGKILKQTPPRWLSRAGSLYLTFTELTLPDGNRISIAASLAGAELDRSSHTRMDAEGRLHGERPGKAWMAINLAVSAGISKEVDDGVQLILEAIVSTATDASTAGTSRIVASCISGLYMVTRHGRDVVLPRFTEMDISLDRPVSVNQISQDSQPARSGVAAGGK